jgi:hypothetical protein
MPAIICRYQGSIRSDHPSITFMGRSYSFLIQLPNNLPSSATIRLTCSY